MSEEKIDIQINNFGFLMKKDDIPKILKGRTGDILKDIEIDHLEWFFGFSLSALTKEILNRYVEITTKDNHSFITPHTKEISERLVKPLKSAKKNYCLGDYSATIALCGVVGEMLAILLWKINEVRVKGKIITKKQEKGLFGRSFEELGQEQRLRILKTMSFITPDQHQKFGVIRASRKPYLHLWEVNPKYKNEKNTALDVYKKVSYLFKKIMGISLDNASTIKVDNPQLQNYLIKNKLKK